MLVVTDGIVITSFRRGDYFGRFSGKFSGNPRKITAVIGSGFYVERDNTITMRIYAALV
jgi:hypothetical protein